MREHMCVYVCVCVCGERERERETDRETERDRERERERLLAGCSLDNAAMLPKCGLVTFFP